MKPEKGRKKNQDGFTLLRLYVAGESPNSLAAISNLKEISEKYLSGKHKVEIVNALDPQVDAFKDGVLVTPTLVVKRDSLPVKTIIGNLSDKPKVLLSLQFEKNSTHNKKTS